MDNSVIAKSGWIFRQTTILKKWKKNWLELYRDGHLKYYESDQSPNADDVIFMPSDCLGVSTGPQEGVHPPEGFSPQALFSVASSTGKTWMFCGENVDDMRAWQLALEQARLSGVRVQPSRSRMMYVQHPQAAPSPGTSYAPQYAYPQGYPQPVYSQPAYAQPAYTVAQPQHTIIYQQQPYYYHPGTDMAMGMMAGAALGSMMWAPMCWW